MDRVLEIGGYAAGYCGRSFVHAGHEVVRVEAGPPPPGWVDAASLDLFLHPGKRRVVTDDRGLVAELAAAADVVVVEGDTAAAVAARGFDAWPTPVKVAITPFGRTGPKRDWQATPGTLLAMGGYTNVMGDADRAPLTVPGHYVEFQAGALAHAAADAARLAGRTASIDVAMLEVVMAASQFTTVMWHCGGAIRRRHGSDYWSVAPADLFRCADGWVYVNVAPAFWDAFTVFLDRPELVIDRRFRSHEKRLENRTALREIVAAELAQMTKADVEARAAEHRIPCGVLATLADVLADPHLAERGYWRDVDDARGARVRAPGGAWRIRGRTAAPRPTAEVADA